MLFFILAADFMQLTCNYTTGLATSGPLQAVLITTCADIAYEHLLTEGPVRRNLLQTLEFMIKPLWRMSRSQETGKNLRDYVLCLGGGGEAGTCCSLVLESRIGLEDINLEHPNTDTYRAVIREGDRNKVCRAAIYKWLYCPKALCNRSET